MDVQHLRTFQSVARTLSFTRAAEALDYAQSSVTAQIQALEKSLNVRLFDRLGRRIVLTEAGQRLLEYAERILHLTDEALNAVAYPTAPSGQLNISTPETLSAYRLPPLLREFRSRFPAVKLILQYAYGATVFDKLSEGSVDVAVTFEYPTLRETAAVACRELTRERLLLIAPPTHPLARCPRIDPAALRDEFLLLTEPYCTYRRMFEENMAERGVRLTATMEFHSVEAIKQCTIAGLGLGVLPEITVARELHEGRLVALAWDEQPMMVSTFLLWHREKWLSPALQAFIRLAEQMVSDPSVLSMTAITDFR
jgi:DNA-binding transcriptional LysR family regulator